MSADQNAAAAGQRCQCGHNAAKHQVAGFDGECIGESCRCRQFRLVAVGGQGAPPSVPATLPTSIPQLLALAKMVANKRCNLLAVKVEAELAEIHAHLTAERSKARSDALADQIREISGGRGHSTDGKTHRGAADKTCPTCGKSGLRNLGVHNRNAHTPRPAPPTSQEATA